MDDKARARFAAMHRRALIDRIAVADDDKDREEKLMDLKERHPEAASMPRADAGRAMLQHAMAAMRRAAAGADEADAVALLWMADAVALSFNGVTLDRAAGLERGRGRPAHSPTRKVIEAVPIWHAVNDLAAKLKRDGVEAPRREAQRRVGLQRGKSPSAVRAACALIDGMKDEAPPAE